VTELIGPDVSETVACGCTVSVTDDGLHIHPCCEEHRRVHLEVAPRFAADLGIPLEVVE
jgi:hypothetical protein